MNTTRPVETSKPVNLLLYLPKKSMDRYLIQSEHTAEDCRMAVKYFVEYHAGFLTHFEWGCKNNPADHHAYAMIDADSAEEALLSVPPLFRPKAKAIKVVQFEAKNARDKLHEENSNSGI